jgi:hypothetical protein
MKQSGYRSPIAGSPARRSSDIRHKRAQVFLTPALAAD